MGLISMPLHSETSRADPVAARLSERQGYALHCRMYQFSFCIKMKLGCVEIVAAASAAAKVH